LFGGLVVVRLGVEGEIDYRKTKYFFIYFCQAIVFDSEYNA